MVTPLEHDRAQLSTLLQQATEVAQQFLTHLDTHPPGHAVPPIAPVALPERGLGTTPALALFRDRYAAYLSGSAGPRYFGFVTGGTTPAALVGDWLTAAYDQNAADGGESSARQLARDALTMFRNLIGLPHEFRGVFVTGATTSAVVGLATARQWIGQERGVDIANEGVASLGTVRVFSGSPHSSIQKALAVLGLGRKSLAPIATEPGREAVNIEALDLALAEAEAYHAGPCIVVANAGTVNTCDFDDLVAVAELKQKHTFWLHIDGAFGAVAAASPRYRPLLAGLEHADSVTVDAHKWLNTPYESAVLFTRHQSLQGGVFMNASEYLPTVVTPETWVHLTPENSQRLRALPTWMTLVAYGRDGYAALVEQCCEHARWFGDRLATHPGFELLAPVRLNGVCFALRSADGTLASQDETHAYVERLRNDGRVFLTPTVYRGQHALRISVTNWRTNPSDRDQAWQALARIDHE